MRICRSLQAGDEEVVAEGSIFLDFARFFAKNRFPLFRSAL